MPGNGKTALSVWSKPVYVQVACGLVAAIGGPVQALDYLSDKWPIGSGQYYKLAKLECVGALEGYQSLERARQTFIEAAREAGVLA